MSSESDAPRVRVSVCGTRAVVTDGRTFRSVCATCGRGGSVPHRTREAAMAAAVRDSNKPCQARPSCGAR